jgi:predicted aminopeptidase
VTADLVTTLTGKEPLSPARVVRFLRLRRRRLRAVKYQGLRNFQSWQQAELDNTQVGIKHSIPYAGNAITVTGLLPSGYKAASRLKVVTHL